MPFLYLCSTLVKTNTLGGDLRTKMTTSTEWLRKRHEILETEFANGPSSTNLYEAVSNSPFYRLPSELRIYILRLAFGDQTIHTGHLVPDHLIEPFTPHFESPRDLKWRSCVCARPPGESPNDDLCGLVAHRNDSFEGLPKTKPLGIAGWLYSCRLGFVFHYPVLLLP